MFERVKPSDPMYGLALRILARMGALEAPQTEERRKHISEQLGKLLELWAETHPNPDANGNPAHCSLCRQRFQCKSNSI